MSTHKPLARAPATGIVSQATPSNQPKRQAIVGLVLHAILVAIHVALIIVHFLGLEHRVTVSLGHATHRASQITTVVPQLFATLYTTILVLVTQQQALWRDFHSPITATALHDRCKAWLSIGSSLNVLYQQLRSPVTTLSVLHIFFYLASIFTIHNTTPVLFNLENITVLQSSRNYDTVLASANYTPDRLHPVGALSIIQKMYGASNLAGLVADKIYDTPSVSRTTYPFGEGFMALNATQTRFSCGALHGLASGSTDILTNVGHDGAILNFTHTANGEAFATIKITAPQFQVSSFIISPLADFTAAALNNLPILIIATNMTLEDDVGERMQSLDFTEPLLYPSGAPITLRLLACQLFMLQGTVNMSYPSSRIIDADSLFSTGNASEDRFARTLKTSAYIPQDDHDTSFAAWVTSLTTADESVGDHNADQDTVLNNLCTQYMNPSGTCSNSRPSALYSYLAYCLSPSATMSTLEGSHDMPQHTTISAFEDCLSQAAAAVTWQGRNAIISNIRQNGTIVIQQLSHHSRLNLNYIPLFVGLGASLTLLWLAYLLTWPHLSQTAFTKDITDPGMLQIAWLMGRNSDFAARVAEVEEPSQDALRKAGMFRLRWAEAVGPYCTESVVSVCPESDVHYGNDRGEYSGTETYQSLPQGLSDRATPQVLTRRHQVLREIAIVALHGGLVTAHAVLVVVFCLRLEHNVTVNAGRAATRLSQAITAASQISGTIYMAILILVTQQQALWRDFHTPTTLTALHDRSAAWLGLGSSFNTLCRQLRTPKMALSVLQVLLYLTSIFAVHITTPILFNVENITRLQAPRKSPAILLPATAIHTDGDGPEANSLADALTAFRPGDYGINDPVGLAADKVYDIPATLGTTDFGVEEGFITFNATQSRFSCGIIPQIAQSPKTSFISTLTGMNIPLTTAKGDNFTYINITTPWDLSRSILLPFAAGPFTATPISLEVPVWIVATNLTLHDDIGQSVSPLQLPEPLFYSDESQAHFTLLACQLFFLYGTVDMSYPGGSIVNANRLFSTKNVSEDRFERTLKNWTYVSQDYQDQVSATSLSLQSLHGGVYTTMAGESTVLCAYTQISPGDDDYMCGGQDAFADFLSSCAVTSTLGSFDHPSDGLQNMSVSVMEDCLSQAVAVLFWQARNTMDPSPQQNGTIIVQELLHRSRLNLNPIPLFIGLGASILLLILACLLTWPRKTRMILHKDLTNTGILQIAWLMGRHPDIAERVAQVEEPTQDALRKAGMFQLRWNEDVDSTVEPSHLESGTAEETTELKPHNENGEASAVTAVSGEED